MIKLGPDGTMVAAADIPVGEVLMALPRRLILNAEVALASKPGQLIAACQELQVVRSTVQCRRLGQQQGRAAVTQRSVLYAYLIHQRYVGGVATEGAGADSHLTGVTDTGDWHLYARSLPSCYSTPFTWPLDDQRRHGAVAAELQRFRPHLFEQYNALFPLLGHKHPDIFPLGVFTRDAWLWAHSSYTTRCFHQARWGVVERDDDSDGAMLPVVKHKLLFRVLLRPRRCVMFRLYQTFNQHVWLTHTTFRRLRSSICLIMISTAATLHYMCPTSQPSPAVASVCRRRNKRGKTPALLHCACRRLCR